MALALLPTGVVPASAAGDAALPSTLASRLLPEKMLAELRGLTDEPQATRIAKLVANLAISTCKELAARRLLSFDALTGGADCERTAFRILELAASQELQKAGAELLKSAQSLLKQFEDRKIVVASRKYREKINLGQPTGVAPTGAFLLAALRGVKISEEMAYLMQARLLTITKKPCLNAKGEEFEKTEICSIDQLVAKLETDTKHKVIGFAQACLTRMSVEYLQREAHKISSLKVEAEFTLLNQMLAPGAVRQAGAYRNYPAKTYSCFYYSMKAILLRLRDTQTIILLKPTELMVKKVQRAALLPLLFQAATRGGDFVRMPDGAETQLKTDEPIIVFEGMIPPEVDREALSKKLLDVNLYEYMLASSAQEDPYERGSTLDAVGIE